MFQLAAKVGGAAVVNNQDRSIGILEYNTAINAAVERALSDNCPKNFIFTSSVCMRDGNLYPDPDKPGRLTTGYYGFQDGNLYGVEKSWAEESYRQFFNPEENFVDIELKPRGNLKIARLHNIFGERMEWDGGDAKAIAAICAKVARCEEGGTIDIWGDGEQTRSFMHVLECVEGLMKIAKSDFTGTIELGSEDIMPINKLTKMIIAISGKNISIRHAPSEFEGQRHRITYNEDIEAAVGWRPTEDLNPRLVEMYEHVKEQLIAKGEYVPSAAEKAQEAPKPNIINKSNAEAKRPPASSQGQGGS